MPHGAHPPARLAWSRRADETHDHIRPLDARARSASLLLVATAGLRTTRTCTPCAALVSAEGVARRACLRSAARVARGRCSVGIRKVRAHVAPPAARQLSSAVHLSTVGGLGCAATRPESVGGAAAARTRSAQLAASPGQRRSSRRHPNSPEQPLPTLILTPSHCRAKNVGVDEKRAASRTHADFPCEQPQPCFKSTVTGGSCIPAPSPSDRHTGGRRDPP